MIVVNSSTEKTMDHKEASEYKMSLEELFCKELDAYCAYKEWVEETEDEVLIMGLEEVMFDEYLHAKFLRDYLIDKGMYNISASDPYEKRFWKIHRQII